MQITKEQLEQDYQSGLSMSEIGRKYGVSTTVVFHRMKKFDIQSRPPSQAMKGKKTSPEVAAKISAAHKGKPKSEEHRKKLSEAIKGNKNSRYGKKAIQGKRCWYVCPNGQTVSMRSQWEVWYAEYLKLNGIEFKYEPETFILEDGSAYTPDFLLISSGEYVEVKGWLTTKHKNRISMFRSEHPNKKLLLADKDYLQSLGIDLRKRWIASKPKFPCDECNDLYSRSYPLQRFCSIACRNKFTAKNKKTNKETTKENHCAIKRKYKGVQSGENNNSSTLTEKDVNDIFDMRESGMLLKDIAKVKNVTISNLGNILKGRSWEHIYQKRRN